MRKTTFTAATFIPRVRATQALARAAAALVPVAPSRKNPHPVCPHDDPPEPAFLSFTREELRDYLRQIIAFFPASLPQKFSRPMLENILCPRGYWHDLDAPFVQEILIGLRDEGLVNLVFREETYVTFNPERKAEVAAELGAFRPKTH